MHARPSSQYRYEHYDPRRGMPRYMIPRVAHCETGALPVTGTQAWVLVLSVAVIALVQVIGLFRA